MAHNSGDETIAGVKTFSSSPVVPTPATGTAAANKAYVDATVTAGAPDASASTKGLVQLTGDLGGTAANPTVPGLIGKITANTAITGATKTKITYDAKGLVTAGADATTADIADSTDKRYVTDAQLTVIGNTSGANTGDQDLSGLVPTTRTVNGHALSANVTVSKSDVGLANADNTADANKPVSTATQSALDAKVAKGSLVINVKDYGATGDGSTDDTTAINAALAAATSGATVMFPSPASFYKITGPLTVAVPGIKILAAKGVEIRQFTWGKPAFDILNTDGVTVTGFLLTYGGATTRSISGLSSFRGDNGYCYSAGVWSNSNRTTVRDCYIKSFAMGVYFSAWNSGTSAFSTGHSHNAALDLEIEGVDHGVLWVAQDYLTIRGIDCHDHVDSSAGLNALHALYGSGNNLLPSVGVTVSDCKSRNNPTGHAYKLMNVYGGSITNCTADNTPGVAVLYNANSVSVSNLSGYNLPDASVYGGFSLETVAPSVTSGVSVSNLTLHRVGPYQRSMYISGSDVSISDVNIQSDRGATATDPWEIVVAGTRIRFNNIKINDRGSNSQLYAGMWIRAACVDVTVDGIECENRGDMVQVENGQTGIVVRYDPSVQRSVGTGTLKGLSYVSGTPTSFTLARGQHARSTTLAAGSATLTPNIALETTTYGNVTDSSAITIAAPVSIPQDGTRQIIQIANNSGGAMGTITWNAKYLLSAGSFVAPTNGQTHTIEFVYDGTNWREVSRSSAATPAPVAHADTQAFTTPGTFTWTKPAGATAVTVICIGGGSGGGSGRRGAVDTVRCGGGGGGGGAYSIRTYPASALSATETVTVGAGGAGAPAITVDDTNGATGTAGGISWFKSQAVTMITASTGGAGGTAATGTGGTRGTSATGDGTNGGAASTTGGVGPQPGPTGTGVWNPGGLGGGAGGGITGTGLNVPNNGGTGGSQPGFVGGTAGTVGASQNGGNGTAQGVYQPGVGGGGGAASITGAAGNGGNGSAYGAGGGGGGASLNGNASGAGGNGADGYVMVITI